MARSKPARKTTAQGKANTTSKAPRKAPSQSAGKTVLPMQPRRRYRRKPGSRFVSRKISIKLTCYLARALQEIRRYQKTSELLIPKAPFVRLVKEIIDQATFGASMRVQPGALEALQEASEAIIISEFESKALASILIFTLIFSSVANLAAIHAKRVIIMQKDMKLV